MKPSLLSLINNHLDFIFLLGHGQIFIGSFKETEDGTMDQLKLVQLSVHLLNRLTKLNV